MRKLTFPDPKRVRAGTLSQVCLTPRPQAANNWAQTSVSCWADVNTQLFLSAFSFFFYPNSILIATPETLNASLINSPCLSACSFKMLSVALTDVVQWVGVIL